MPSEDKWIDVTTLSDTYWIEMLVGTKRFRRRPLQCHPGFRKATGLGLKLKVPWEYGIKTDEGILWSDQQNPS